MADITNSTDVLDARDIIARVEELESERDACNAKEYEAWQESDDAEELAQLTGFLESLAGYGGDHEWRGKWYPVTLVRDSYFTSYAIELAEDIGAINREATWPNNCIDWARASDELKVDCSYAEFDGVTYWYRS